MPERGSGAGWDIRHLFSPPSRAAEGREDPHTEPHAPAHGAPGNPTPITMEDMSDQGGVGSASDPEATLTHPSARDIRGGETTPGGLAPSGPNGQQMYTPLRFKVIGR